MPDRRLVYTVEIDASQAEAAGRKLREMFAQIAGKEAAGGAASPMAAQVEQLKAAEVQAKKTASALATLGGMDIATAPVDQLRARLDQLRRDAGQTERALRAMYEASTTNTRGNQTNAQFQTLVEDVRRRVDDQTANQLAAIGYAPRQWLGREFAPEHAYEIQEWTRGEASKAGQVSETKRQSAAAQIEALQLEQQLAAEQLAAAQVEKEIAGRRLAAIADMDRSQMGFAQQDEIESEFQKLVGTLDQLTDDEARLLAEMNQAAAQAGAKIEQMQAQAARANLGATGDIGAFAEAGAGTGGSRLNISVSKASVEQAQRLATLIEEQNADLKEQAAMYERIAQAAGSRYTAEHEQIRQTNAERQQAERQIAEIKANADKTVSANKAAEQEAKAAIASANQQKEAARSVTYTARAEYEERTALARAASTERIEQEKRETAIVKAQIKEQQDQARAAARAQATTTARRGPLLGGMFSPTNLMYGAAGALGLYSIDQVARNLYGAGAEGAQQIRQQATFEQFAARLGLSANKIVEAIKRASKETISETDAMGLAAQVMAQKFAGSSRDITGDMETIVAFSRRASQIFTDEQGQFLSTQEVFSRLVKFAREGNKELVDQFGLSNQRIADALGITVQGLASANGATDRWRGLIKVLGEELGRLGAPIQTVADEIEATEARTTTAINRMKQAMAPITAGAAGVLAAGAEELGTALGTSGIGTLDRQIRGRPVMPTRGFEHEAAVRALDAYNAAMERNSQTAGTYSAALQRVLSNVANMDGDVYQNTNALEALARQLELVAKGSDAYALIMAQTTEAGLKQNEQVFALAVELGNLERMYVSGEISAQQYGTTASVLAQRLNEVAAAAGFAASGIASVNAQQTPYQAAMAEKAAPYAQFGGYNYGLIAPRFGADRTAQQDAMTQRAADAAALAPYSAENQEKLRTQFAMRLHEDQAKEDRRLAEETARKAQSDWESAAEKAKQKWESAISSIPGLFGTSGVTAEQMAAAEAGVPQRFADSWLRELKDEVYNAVDRPNVDIRDAAARLGIDPNADPKAIYAQVESAWRDSSLFAGGKNLDLIDIAAVKSSLDRQAAGESGQQAIRDYLAGLGIGPATDGESAPGAGIIPTPEQATAQAGDLATAIRTTFDSQQVRADFEAVGGAVLGYIHAGYASGAMEADWTGPITDAVVAQLSGQIAAMFGEEQPPP